MPEEELLTQMRAAVADISARNLTPRDSGAEVRARVSGRLASVRSSLAQAAAGNGPVCRSLEELALASVFLEQTGRSGTNWGEAVAKAIERRTNEVLAQLGD